MRRAGSVSFASAQVAGCGGVQCGGRARVSARARVGAGVVS